MNMNKSSNKDYTNVEKQVFLPDCLFSLHNADGFFCFCFCIAIGFSQVSFGEIVTPFHSFRIGFPIMYCINL